MLLYEVNVSIASDLAQEYLIWLRSHIRQMLMIDGFASAKILLDTSSNNTDNKITKIVAQYEVVSEIKLNNYFRDHAERMRSQLPEKYLNYLQIHRRVLSVEQILTLLK